MYTVLVLIFVRLLSFRANTWTIESLGVRVLCIRQALSLGYKIMTRALATFKPWQPSEFQVCIRFSGDCFR